MKERKECRISLDQEYQRKRKWVQILYGTHGTLYGMMHYVYHSEWLYISTCGVHRIACIHIQPSIVRWMMRVMHHRGSVCKVLEDQIM